jgi:circadian clock protein KaiC
VFVTLEEPAADLRTNLRTLGWDVEAWEARGDWAFVDASPAITLDQPKFGLETLAAQIGHAVDRTGAERLALDSLSAVMSLQPDVAVARQMLRRLVASLRSMRLTVVLTIETPGDPGGVTASDGVEEFVADNVVLMRNVREGGFRRRTLEVLKMRGAMHHKGDVPFTIVPGEGLIVLPVTAPQERANPQRRRIATGNVGLDEMTHGGIFAASSTLISGPTGTGKTLVATQFAAAGADSGETVLLMAYEESRDQVLANGEAFGYDLAELERRGRLHVVSLYPEVASLDDHLVEIRELVERLQPDRLVVDSLSALQRLGSDQSFRGFVVGLTSYARTSGVALFMTTSSPQLLGGTSVTDHHISGLVDAIIVLRHVETRSALRRGIVVLRMRGSDHEHQIRELRFADGKLVVGAPFEGLGGILTGQPVDRPTHD